MAKRKHSNVWEYFQVDENDYTKVKCLVPDCNKELRRGKIGAQKKDLGTKTMWEHLRGFHPEKHKLATQTREEEDAVKKAKEEELKKKQNIFLLAQKTGEELVKKQQKLKETWQRSTKWEDDSDEQRQMEFLLSEWLASGLQPYVTVQNQQFIDFITRLNRRFNLPSEKVVRTRIIPDIHGRVKTEMLRILKEGNFTDYSATTDIWTSSSQHGYLSFTLHYITHDWERKSAVLACLPFDDSHTAKHIADELKKIAQEWLPTKRLHMMLRDNALNMVNAMNLNEWGHTGCFLHGLNLIVNHSILQQSGVKLMMARAGGLVGHVRRSPKAKAALLTHQIAVGLQEKDPTKKDDEQTPTRANTLILGEPTRWSTYYQMLERLQQQKKAIRRAEDDVNFKLTPAQTLTTSDWILIPKVMQLLGPIATATTESESENATLSDVIGHVKLITKKVTKADAAGIGTLKDEILTQLKRYYAGNDPREHFVDVEAEENYTLATILDPRYKTKAFIDDTKAELAKDLLLTRAKEREAECATPATKQPVRDEFDSTDDEELPDEPTAAPAPPPSLAEIQTKAYLADERLKKTSDPLRYWRANAARFTLLAPMAKRYLSAPVGSVSSEREFKVASQISGGARVRLRPDNVEMLLFLKYNLRALGYNSYKLPRPGTVTPPPKPRPTATVTSGALNDPVASTSAAAAPIVAPVAAPIAAPIAISDSDEDPIPDDNIPLQDNQDMSD